jgi:hypothetical protein
MIRAKVGESEALNPSPLLHSHTFATEGLGANLALHYGVSLTIDCPKEEINFWDKKPRIK